MPVWIKGDTATVRKSYQPTEVWEEQYREDAQDVLDKLSETFHPVGLTVLLWFMIEAMDDGYYGSENK